MKKNYKILFLNFFIFFILIILLEAITGNYFKKGKINCMYVGCNMDETYHHNLYTKEKIFTKYTKGKYGFRNRIKPPSDIDILIIGGSTVDSRYIDDKKTWPKLLEKKISDELKLDIDVVNSGIDGQSTFGHIYNFKNWYRYIDDFKPKIILFYIGINDSYIFSNENNSEERIYDKPTEIILLSKKYFANNSNFLYPIYKILKGTWIARKFKAGHQKNLSFVNNNNIFVKSEKLKNNSIYHLNKFQKRLHNLTKLSLELNATPIFITQKSMFWEKRGKEIYSTDNETGLIGFHQEAISQSIINFSKENNFEYIDTTGYDFKYDHFYDYSHFNSNGSEFFANLLYDDVIKIIKKLNLFSNN